MYRAGPRDFEKSEGDSRLIFASFCPNLYKITIFYYKNVFLTPPQELLGSATDVSKNFIIAPCASGGIYNDTKGVGPSFLLSILPSFHYAEKCSSLISYSFYTTELNLL